MPPHIISIEGNIGAGKSTLYEHLRIVYKNNPHVVFVDEPVDEWNTIVDESGIPILQRYYENQEKYAFSFQIMALGTRLSLMKKALATDCSIIIMERSVITDSNIFARMLFDDGKINLIEYKIYMKWFIEYTNNLPPINIIYLKTDPSVVYSRVIKRGRVGETIPLDYLVKCHEYHEKWLNSDSNPILYKLQINGDEIHNSVNETITIWAEQVKHYITCLPKVRPLLPICERFIQI